jgi:hypothetical protein
MVSFFFWHGLQVVNFSYAQASSTAMAKVFMIEVQFPKKISM